MIPNLFRSLSLSVFLSRMWLKMALACCGSAEANALFSALSSSSKVAEGPPSKNPAYVFYVLLFAWISKTLFID